MPVESLEQLQAALAGREYLLHSVLPDRRAVLQFAGRFEGVAVLWDMQLFTLADYAASCDARAADPHLRGWMRITPLSPAHCRVELALRVPMIDEPVVKKALVLMRNYRRLQAGLRTWGDPA